MRLLFTKGAGPGKRLRRKMFSPQTVFGLSCADHNLKRNRSVRGIPDWIKEEKKRFFPAGSNIRPACGNHSGKRYGWERGESRLQDRRRKEKWIDHSKKELLLPLLPVFFFSRKKQRNFRVSLLLRSPDIAFAAVRRLRRCPAPFPCERSR